MTSDLSGAVQPEDPAVAAVLRRLEDWAEAPGKPFPYSPLVALYRLTGKHFVPGEVATLLARLRGEIPAGAGEALLRDFLDCALDKHDGRYNYATYCALGLLDFPEITAPRLSLTEIAEKRDRALLALLGDLVAFELRALETSGCDLPLMRPGRTLAEKRIGRALTALRPSLRRLGWAGSGETAWSEFLSWRDSEVSETWKTRLDLSMMPVHVVHDEFMFLRILQSFEANFAWVALLLRDAIADLGEDPGSALERLEAATEFLREAARLFPLLGTMQIAAFREFRRYTEGASAIQSTGYKTVEALCRRPDPDRLASVAFASVPEVQKRAEAGENTLEERFHSARRDTGLSPVQEAAIASEMSALSDQLMRWRQAHFQIARRFLGEQTGTGYTEGVPYLDAVRFEPVFREPPRRG